MAFSKDVMSEGDLAQLSCSIVSGDEPVSITWTFHGDRVGPETGIKTMNLGSKLSILVIESVSYAHQGEYTCQATNTAGVQTQTAVLKVNGRSEKEKGGERDQEAHSSCLFHLDTHFLTEPPDMNDIYFGRDVFREGDTAQIICTIAKGDDPMKISWSFHGHSISSDLGIETTNVGNRASLLIISSVDHKHRGNYTCRAENKAGFAASTTELKVNGSCRREGKEERVRERESQPYLDILLSLASRTAQNHAILFWHGYHE